MRHNRTRRRLKRNFSHRKQMLENLVMSLLQHQAVRTTWPKAKEAQKLADRLITLGKAGTLHSRRRAFAILGNRKVTQALFERIAPRFKARAGGYTRVLHYGVRQGDGAPLALLELTEKEIVEKKPRPEKKAKAEPREGAKAEAAERKAGAPEARPKAEPHRHVEKPKKSFFSNIQRFFRKKGGDQ